MLVPSFLLAVALFALAAAEVRWLDDSVWWRAAASAVAAAGVWFAVRLLDAVVWERLLPRTKGVRIPRLLRQVVAIVLAILVLAVVMSCRFGAAQCLG
jgi:hypothetical protein